MKVKSVKLNPTSVACHTCSLDALNKLYKRKLQNKKTKINEKLDTHRNKMLCFLDKSRVLFLNFKNLRKKYKEALKHMIIFLKKSYSIGDVLKK